MQYDTLAAVENGAHDGLGFVERLTHANPLAALAGVGESDFGGGFGLCAMVAVGDGLQPIAQGWGVGEDYGGAVGEVAASGGGHVGQIRQGVGLVRFGRRQALVKPS